MLGMNNQQYIDSLSHLFTMSFTVDEQLCLSDYSAHLAARCTAATPEKGFFEIFRIHRPFGVMNYEDLIDGKSSLFLLVSCDDTFAIKGQFAELPEGGLRFLGMPWHSWISENNPAMTLELDEFPRFDAQLDQQFYLANKRSMVSDLEALNEELKRMREVEREALRDRSELFAMMSHEMRTPLNGVINALQLLKRPRRSTEREQLLTVASNAADHLLSVINYALDHSRLDAIQLHSELFNLKSLVDDVLNMVQGRAEEKLLQLTCEIDPAVPLDLLGDAQKLRQIVINLLGNAVKFTERGCVKVRINLTSLQSNEVSLTLEVEDDGCGMSELEQQHMFDAYWSQDTNSGTGLGLSICRRFVELMQGDIRVVSEPGNGTCITLELPFELAKCEEPLPDHTSDHENVRFMGRILVVDDNETNLMLEEMILNSMGLQVTTAKSGLEAIDQVEEERFDLVLMDISMPVMTGDEAMQRIKVLRPNLPVVAVTAHVGEAWQSEICDLGFDGYLQKPLTNASLITELNRWFVALEPVEKMPIPASAQVNKSALSQMYQQIGERQFLKVRQVFLDENRRRLGELLGAWIRRDVENMARIAHAMAGNVASFGGEQLHALLKNIEHAGLDNDINTIIDIIQQLEEVAELTFDSVANFTPEKTTAVV
jgi:two-component system sensor histidine kinase TorS